MIDIIINNPFRILGVWSNAKQAEIVRNIGRMNAYLNVGRPVEYPSDLKFLIPEIQRTKEMAQKAQADINLPKDKLRYALFWFCNGEPVDEIGLNNLISGDVDKAMSIFIKKESYSSLVNRGVLHLIKGDYSQAVTAYSTLLHNYIYRPVFVAAICGGAFDISEQELSHLLLDELIKVIGAAKLLPLVTDAADKTYVKDAAFQEPISIINEEIAKARSSCSGGSAACYRAGKNLITKTRTPLRTLRLLNTEGDVRANSAIDNLAKQILQCGINYYNESNDGDCIDKAMELQKYALDIAVGKLTKDRCRENVKTLEEAKKRSAYEADLLAVASKLKSFGNYSSSITRARTLVTECKPHLANIKTHLGAYNELYLKASSAVANNALGMVIDVVNSAQNSVTASSLTSGSLKTTLDSALNAMNLIATLDMTSDVRSRLNTNKSTLQNMYNQLSSLMDRASSSSSYGGYSRPSNNSSGCYIATMVYGDYDHPLVMVLREFSDNFLKRFALGRSFIRFYYKYSPTWVEHLQDKKGINRIIRRLLDKFIELYKNEKN
jgi:hypothetical protein